MLKNLLEQIESKRQYGEQICQKLSQCIEQLGFPQGTALSYPDYNSAHFELIKDPLTGQFNLAGFWKDHRGHKVGQLQFQSDDSCYAEYDVVKNHPSKKQWFVEKVTAWGSQARITAEASLLKLPE